MQSLQQNRQSNAAVSRQISKTGGGKCVELPTTKVEGFGELEL